MIDVDVLPHKDEKWEIHWLGGTPAKTTVIRFGEGIKIFVSREQFNQLHKEIHSFEEK